MVAIRHPHRAALPGAERMLRLLRGALGQTMATAMAVQLGLFLTGPLVARMLGVEDRGHLAALTLWPTTIATIAIWGVPTAITYERATHGTLHSRLLRRLGIVAAIQIFATVVVHAVILTVWSPDAWDAMRVAAVGSLLLGPAFIARDYGLAVLQGARDFRWFNRARLSQVAVYLPLVLLLFATETGTLASNVIVSVMAAAAMVGVAFAAAARQQRHGAPLASSSTVRDLLAFGQRAHFGRLMPVERFRADQIAVAIFLPPAALGIYAVATAFTNVLRFLTQAIGYVAFPTVAGEADPARARALTWRYVRVAVALSGGAILALEIAGPWLIRLLFGGAFGDAGAILRILLPGVGFVGVRRVLAESLRGGGYAAATSLAEAATGLAFLALIYPMLIAWELRGVAAAVSIAEGLGLAVLLAFMLRAERRADPLPDGAPA